MSLPIERHKRHKVQALHNRDLLKENCFTDGVAQTSLKYNDWTITVSFYVALHYVQNYLSKNNYKATFSSHTERNDYLKHLANMDRKIDKVVARYISLYKLSRVCRYTPCHFHYLKASDVQRCFIFATKDLPTELTIV